MIWIILLGVAFVIRSLQHLQCLPCECFGRCCSGVLNFLKPLAWKFKYVNQPWGSWRTVERHLRKSQAPPLCWLYSLLEDFSDTQWLLDNYNFLTMIFEYRRSPSEEYHITDEIWQLECSKVLHCQTPKEELREGLNSDKYGAAEQFCIYAIYQQYRLRRICCMSSLPLLDGMLAVDISTAAAVLASQQLNCAFS